MPQRSGKSYEKYDAKRTQKSVNFPQSAMLLGSMSVIGVEKNWLKRSINIAVYQDVIDYFLLLYIEDTFGNNEFIFQRDLAPLTLRILQKNYSGRSGYLYSICIQIA